MYSSEESMIHLPSYEKLVTPINGSYFLIVSVIIFGGAWGFCLSQKNGRADNGVPYPDWDEGWDDKNAVKSPGGAANSVSISANGLTARGPSRDGWDPDWDN
ncbi:hypothetical protein F2Q68_00030789 [Brassica cretica]|uniref:Uncharacterized protein n=1 Tax=Brassica cretica TaxID=69181 RepID=A0A8S9GAJ6_BRACR|nr:hypothetical protein F2Q68_00030789 [Brassica cretica]